MREILFKAKRKDNGELVEGYYYKRIQGNRVVDAIEKYDGDINSIEYYEIDPNTLCQYTGLTDKNGKKIWENDIACTPYLDPTFGGMVNYKIVDDYTWKVVFVDGGFCVENEDKIINLRNFTNGKCIKVIGNIFDNPELMKGEERENLS